MEGGTTFYDLMFCKIFWSTMANWNRYMHLLIVLWRLGGSFQLKNGRVVDYIKFDGKTKTPTKVTFDT